MPLVKIHKKGVGEEVGRCRLRVGGSLGEEKTPVAHQRQDRSHFTFDSEVYLDSFAEQIGFKVLIF